MKADNWSEISEILVDCLEIEKSERQRYLDKLNINSELRAEVETYLSFEEEVENSLNLSAFEFSRGFFDEDEISENSVLGQKFGVYQVLRELGYGGMGAVYLAERTDGKFDQKVALKLLKREMNTTALRRRFQQERDILASLEHPNIARLLNAGMTDDNIPYIAMEYVEGVPIDDYCNKHNLGLNQRLDLFRDVCGAVDFAHRNLIVHRDLKPSNILVTNEGKPKLLDFGISKILSAEIETADSATITKLGVMTPSYASPEQIQSKSVTTATDIYSLGVILCELLSGHRPFETKEDNLKEIYKAIIEIDPPLPSSMVDTISKQFKEITEAKTIIKSGENGELEIKTPETKSNKKLQTNPQTVHLSSNSIRGDLDNIILKALRKEPERRYSSAENLSEDIKRHLRGLPVTARPNTFSYRAEKFIKRNRASVFAASLILVAIIGGIAATLWQARAAQAERVKAERRFNDVRKLANSFIFDLSPKIEKLPGSTEAREELVKLALEYLDSLSKEASNDLELQRELAAAYEKVGDVQGNPSSPNIGDFKGATESYKKSQNIRRNLLKKEPNNLVEQGRLAHNLIIMGIINLNGGDSAKAKENFDEGVAVSNKILEKDPKNFEVRNNLANLIFRQGQIQFFQTKYDETLKYYNRSYEIYKTLNAEKPGDYKTKQAIASTLLYIGETIGWAGDVKTATEKMQQSINVLAPLAKEHPNDNLLRRDLMLAYLKKGEHLNDIEGKKQETLENFDKSLAIAEQTLDQDPQNFQAKRDKVLIYQYRSLALDDTETIKNYGKSIGILNELKTEDPNNKMLTYDLGTTYFYLAQTYLKVKDYKNSLETYQKAVEKGQEYLSNDPAQTASKNLIAQSIYGKANCYWYIAEQKNDNDVWKQSLEAYRDSLEKMKQLDKEGKLRESDKSKLEEIGGYINEIEAKLK